jgi:hypothetical protein
MRCDERLSFEVEQDDRRPVVFDMHTDKQYLIDSFSDFVRSSIGGESSLHDRIESDYECAP